MNAVLRHWNNFTLRLAQAPYWPLALLARFSLAALFWRSGQTKISGFAVDPLDGTWQWGWPQLSDSTIYPDAYPTHGLWAVALLALIVRGPGLVSVDHWLAHRFKS